MDSNEGKWFATPLYVIPIGDLKPHMADNTLCWCKPVMDDGILIHNSMDKRELYERGELKHN